MFENLLVPSAEEYVILDCIIHDTASTGQAVFFYWHRSGTERFSKNGKDASGRDGWNKTYTTNLYQYFFFIL